MKIILRETNPEFATEYFTVVSDDGKEVFSSEMPTGSIPGLCEWANQHGLQVLPCPIKEGEYRTTMVSEQPPALKN